MKKMVLLALVFSNFLVHAGLQDGQEYIPECTPRRKSAEDFLRQAAKNSEELKRQAENYKAAQLAKNVIQNNGK